MFRKCTRYSFALALFIAALVGVGLVSTPGFASPGFNGDVPISGIFFNACTGNTDNFSGTQHIVINESESANGVFHLVFQVNVQLDLTDPTFGTCPGHANSQNGFSGPAGETTTQTSTGKIAFECPGPANNALIYSLNTTTLNPDGTVGFSQVFPSFKCK